MGAQQQAERECAGAERRSAVREPARRLAAALLSRGWRIGLPQITIGPSLLLPWPGQRKSPSALLKP